MKKNRNYIPQTASIAKDDLMFIIILGLWIIIMLYFDPKILRYLRGNTSLSVLIPVLSFIFCINMLWLFGIYHLVISFFSVFVARPQKIGHDVGAGRSPAVAVLYLVMNDFREEAVLSCLNQRYDNFDIFILDDSTDCDCKDKVDCFSSVHEKIKLIRRTTRENFKAGNLNNALKLIHKQYDYIAISDSDGILPSEFIEKLMPYFSLNKNIGFVQAKQIWNEKQKSAFAQDLGMNTDVHWNYYVPAKDGFGFVMFYGHGAIIRTDVWAEVNGFPDSITEDIVFSSIIREKGYFGVFAPDVICLEDFPSDYKSFRIRNERWIKGTTEYLFRWYPKLLFSRNVTWFEKLDVLISAGILLQPFIFIYFLIVVSVILPLTSKFFNLYIPLVATFSPGNATVATFLGGFYFHSKWTWDFFLVMTVTAFAQFASLSMRVLYQPIRVIRYVGAFMFVCLASSIASFVNILTLLITRRTRFLVTGVKDRKDTLEHKVIIFFEIIFSLVFVYSVFSTGNVWLMTVVIAVLLNPLVYKLEWDSAFLGVVTYIPFILILAILLLLCSSIG
ncbi:MAG: glycosyltransferase [Candidatus Omnitrophica bacterium]|nr:glycosyltransferase [Candidatus Omnitrophota bacterium]